MNLRRPGSYYFPAAGDLGFGLPAVVGVQLAQPQRRVVALIGDSSANCGITMFRTAAQCRIPVVFTILKNGTYGALRWSVGVLKTGDSPGLDVPGLDFCAIAKGCGVKAVHADTRDSFEAALRIVLDANESTVTKVPTLIVQPH